MGGKKRFALFHIKTENAANVQYVAPPVDPAEMVMDPQTYKDLEIFTSEDGSISLYDLCNTTRTTGGARALRTRMKKPWNESKRIRAVQESLGFILVHRKSFDRLPPEGTTEAVEGYLNSSVAGVSTENDLLFWPEAFEIRFQHDFRPFSRISRGVYATTALIRTLRRIAADREIDPGAGEAGVLLAELRELISSPELAVVPQKETWALPWWTVLRHDRLFRSEMKKPLERMLELVFDLDALVSMADTVARDGFVMPEVVEGPLAVEAEDLMHPFIIDAVANPFHLSQQQRMLFLTGPNMAGKTTYLRAVGIGLYLAHLGMGVPARRFRFSPCERLFSSITIHDDVRKGVSFFRAEALRVKSIAAAVTGGYRVVAFMDEPFKGTNVKDALDASRAIMQRFAEKDGCLFLVSSHLIELGEQMTTSGQVDCQRFEAGESEEQLEFDYKLRPGVSTQRLGMRVLREEGIFDLLDREPEKAALTA